MEGKARERPWKKHGRGKEGRGGGKKDGIAPWLLGDRPPWLSPRLEVT